MAKESNKKNFYDTMCDRALAVYRRCPKRIDMAFVLILFAILLCVRINDINIKNQLHSDEVFSLMLSTCNGYYNENIPDGEYSGSELKRMIAVDDIGGVKGALHDIAQLWHNNGDAPHASLYYMVLRVALIGFDSFDVHELAWRGGSVNLLFFVLSFFLMYKLLRRIYGDRILLVLAGLAMAFGNWMSIRNTLLIREYQMAETGIILLTLIGVNLIIALRKGEVINPRKYLLWFSLTIAYVVSLGYFNAIYVIFFGAGIMVACYHYKRKDLIIWLLASGIVAVVVALILYPGFFNFLLHDSVHKERAFRSVKNIFRYVFVRDIQTQFFTVYGTMFMGVLALVVVLSKNRIKLVKSPNFAWIPVIVLVCMFVIMHASLLKMPRYYYSMMPMLALIVPHVISCVPNSWKGYFELLVCLYFPIIAILFPVRLNYQWKALQHNLNQDTSIYMLNPNEVVQLIPCVNDTMEYVISNGEYVDIHKDRATFIVTKNKIGINNDSIRSHSKLLWGKHIYLYEFNFVRKNAQVAD